MILVGCSGLKNKNDLGNTNSEIISQKFHNVDSLSIQIIYKELTGCTDLRIGRINIKRKNGNIVFAHLPTNEESEFEHFSGKDNGLIDLIIAFEKEAKESKSMCGGIAGGTGYEIDLTINEEETKFGFCKAQYDGINELVSEIRILEQKTNANNVYN